VLGIDIDWFWVSSSVTRKLVQQQKMEGLLTETSSRPPLRWAIPEHAERYYLPELVSIYLCFQGKTLKAQAVDETFKVVQLVQVIILSGQDDHSVFPYIGTINTGYSSRTPRLSLTYRT